MYGRDTILPGYAGHVGRGGMDNNNRNSFQSTFSGADGEKENGSVIGRGERMSPSHQSESGRESSAGSKGGADNIESWKRAAEVTSQLKLRIEQMKAKQGLASRGQR